MAGPAVTDVTAPRISSRIGISVTAMLAMIAMIMSSTMVNVAIPDIMGAFGIGQDQAHWISTGFLSAMTAGMLLNAWLVTSFGPRNVFIASLALFCLTAFAGQYAPTFTGVVLARFAQGLCAGLIQPLAMTTVFLAYPPEQRPVAMGWIGMGIVFGPTIGPVLGGFIVDIAHWRLVFAAPVPVMAVAAAMAALYLPGRSDDDGPGARFNLPSFALVTGALILLLNGITIGQREGWSDRTVFLLLFTACAAMLWFVIREFRSEAPLLQLRLFAYRTYVASAIVAFIFGAGMFGSLYVVPVMVQTVQGYTALKAGLMLLPGGIASMFTFPLAGVLSARFRVSHTITAGLGVFAVSCALLAGAGMLTDFWTMALLVAFGRIGLGLVIPPLNLAALSAVPRDLVAYAAGTLNFIRMTGAALGVSILALILDSRIAGHGRELASSQTADNGTSMAMIATISRELAATGLTDHQRAMASTAWLREALVLKANELAFQDGFLVLVGLFAVAMATTMVLLRRPRDLSSVQSSSGSAPAGNGT